MSGEGRMPPREGSLPPSLIELDSFGDGSPKKWGEIDTDDVEWWRRPMPRARIESEISSGPYP